MRATSCTLLGWLVFTCWAGGATLSNPQVDAYNVRVGTQTFSGLYHFTTNTLLVETANAIHDMGSDVIKLELASGFASKYNITLGPNITNLVSLVRDEPSCRKVLDMPFRHYVAWTYPFAYWWPFDGYSASEAASEYKEFYDLTRYFLTNYNNSGKTFYLGHWEGDGYLTGGDFGTNPTPTMVKGFIDCLNHRQKAIDDAKRATVFTNVNVFCYAEANRVRDAINNNPNSNLRMINAVIPQVTNLDYVSYSSYDMQRLSSSAMTATLDYMEQRVPTNKAAAIPGERIWIGEYGFANGGDSPAAQEPETRAYIQRLLNYGRRGIPYILFWEIYDNETNGDGSYKYFYLIDQANNKAPCYYLHQRFINAARCLVARFNETNGRLPTDAEFVALVSPMLDQPLAAPVHSALGNQTVTLTSPATAQVSASFTQGVYGDDGASVSVFYGRGDGGTDRAAWEASRFVALNTNFNPRTFSTLLPGLAPNTNFFFRFYATNSSGEAWAPASATFSTQTLNPADFGCRLKITFSGYDRSEPLVNFPALVNLSPTLPGFSYRQFASPAGGDLRFTDAGGFLILAHEIDEWNTAGTSRVWVRVPQLATTNDFIWAYWSNPLAATPPPYTTNGAVWSPEHLLVWHLKENAFPFADSALQHPAFSGGLPASTAALVGSGVSLNGSSQFLNAGPVNLGSAFTLTASVRIDSTATNIQTVWANKPGGWNSPGFALYVNSYNTSDHQLRLETGDGSTGLTAETAVGAVSPGGWHNVAAVIDQGAGSARLFVDGTDRTQASSITADFPNQTAINLGRFTNSSLYFKGVIDEARIEVGARSSNWVWATWMTAASNGTLSSYSSVTQTPPALSLAVSSNSIVLSWPASGVGFNLYSTADLMPPIAWVAATNQPGLADAQWQVILPGDSSIGRFYRLQAD